MHQLLVVLKLKHHVVGEMKEQSIICIASCRFEQVLVTRFHQVPSGLSLIMLPSVFLVCCSVVGTKSVQTKGKMLASS